MVSAASPTTPRLSSGGPARAILSALIALGMLTVSLTAIAWPAGIAAQGAEAGLAAFAPDTSLLYAELELDQSSAQWQLADELVERSGASDLLPMDDMRDTEAGLAELGETFDGQAALVLTTFPDTGATIDTVTDSAAGVATDPAALAEGDIPEGFAVIFKPSDPQALFDSIVELSAEDAGETEEVEYNGYTIRVTSPADEAAAGSAFALVDEIVVASTVAEDVEAIIDVVAGDTAPLADSGSFSSLRGQFESDDLAFGYINGPALLAGAEEQDPEGLAEVPEELLASVNAYSAFAFRADEAGFRLDILANPADGSVLPEADTLDPTFAERVSADSLVYAGGMNLGANASLQYLALLFAEGLVGIDAEATPIATPNPEEYADGVFAQAESVLGFNIKTDFLDQMAGEWGMGLTVANITDSSADVDVVFVSETADATSVADVTDKITAIISSQGEDSFEISSREVAGSSVTVVDLGDAGFPLAIEYGVVDDQFMVGINDGIDDFVNGPEAPLSESENFTATMDQLPETFTSVSYVNLEEALPLIDLAVSGAMGSDVVDADPACEDYDTQEEAQAAFDEDQFENFALDQDFDGAACEDHFAPATPEASPAPTASSLNLLSIGSVTFQNEGASGTSVIILIGE